MQSFLILQYGKREIKREFRPQIDSSPLIFLLLSIKAQLSFGFSFPLADFFACQTLMIKHKKTH